MQATGAGEGGRAWEERRGEGGGGNWTRCAAEPRARPEAAMPLGRSRASPRRQRLAGGGHAGSEATQRPQPSCEPPWPLRMPAGGTRHFGVLVRLLLFAGQFARRRRRRRQHRVHHLLPPRLHAANTPGGQHAKPGWRGSGAPTGAAARSARRACRRAAAAHPRMRWDLGVGSGALSFSSSSSKASSDSSSSAMLTARLGPCGQLAAFATSSYLPGARQARAPRPWQR